MNRKLKTVLLGLAVSAAAVPGIAMAATNIVTNGDFATNSLSGFTQFGNTGFTGVSGSRAYFGPVGSIGGISQIISTIAGHTYSYSYDLEGDGGPTNSFSATVGGVTLASLTNFQPFANATFTGTFVATGNNDTLSFAFRQDPNYQYLDNISVTALAGAVPEPATWALMIIGFGAVGGAMRRKSAVRTTVRYA